MPLGDLSLSDNQSEGDATTEFCVRQVQAAAGVQPIHQSGVEGIQPALITDTPGMIKRGFYFGSLVATKAESDTISKYRNDINTYVSEMFMKFILGTEPLSNYDAFVTKLKGLGIDQYKAVKQAQFTRFNS